MNRSCPLYVAVVGFIVTFLGLISAWYAFPKLENHLIEQKTAMIDGNPTYEVWKKMPFPFKFKIYLFNVTNPEEFQKGEKAIVKEVGPYVYDEYTWKEILSINDENDTIKYYMKRQYYFNEKESGCRSDNDLLTVVNIALVSTAIIVESMAPMAVSLVNDAVPFFFPGATTIFVTAKVKDILFDGLKLDCQAPEVEMLCGALSAKKPPTLRMAENNKDYLAAVFHHINGTNDGPYIIKRGIQNSREKGKIVSYKEEKFLTKWADSSCNMINGTDLTVSPTLQEKPPKIYFFVPDICRSMSGLYEKETEISGIKGLMYSTNITLGKEEELTSCFCTANKEKVSPNNPSCSPSGTMDISPCVEAPIIISYPNFFDGDPSLREYVEGLTPDKEKHSSYIVVEQKTGSTLKVRVRLQTNIKIKNVIGMELMENITEGVFPVLWLEEAVDLPEKPTDLLKSNLFKLNMLNILKWMLVVLGILIIAVSYGLNIYKEKILCFSIDRSKLTESVSKLHPKIIEPNGGGNMLLNLYPQTDNNKSSGLIRRHNQVHNTWQITN